MADDRVTEDEWERGSQGRTGDDDDPQGNPLRTTASLCTLSNAADAEERRARALAYGTKAVAVSSNKQLTSKFRGVCWNKKNKRWQAAINSSGKYLYLGSYDTEAEAAAVFDKAAIRIRGLKARLNFCYSDYVDQDGKIKHEPLIDELISDSANPTKTRRQRNAAAGNGAVPRGGADDVDDGAGAEAGAGPGSGRGGQGSRVLAAAPAALRAASLGRQDQVQVQAGGQRGGRRRRDVYEEEQQHDEEGDGSWSDAADEPPPRQRRGGSGGRVAAGGGVRKRGGDGGGGGGGASSSGVGADADSSGGGAGFARSMGENGRSRGDGPGAASGHGHEEAPARTQPRLMLAGTGVDPRAGGGGDGDGSANALLSGRGVAGMQAVMLPRGSSGAPQSVFALGPIEQLVQRLSASATASGAFGVGAGLGGSAAARAGSVAGDSLLGLQLQHSHPAAAAAVARLASGLYRDTHDLQQQHQQHQHHQPQIILQQQCQQHNQQQQHHHHHHQAQSHQQGAAGATASGLALYPAGQLRVLDPGSTVQLQLPDELLGILTGGGGGGGGVEGPQAGLGGTDASGGAGCGLAADYGDDGGGGEGSGDMRFNHHLGLQLSLADQASIALNRLRSQPGGITGCGAAAAAVAREGLLGLAHGHKVLGLGPGHGPGGPFGASEDGGGGGGGRALSLGHPDGSGGGTGAGGYGGLAAGGLDLELAHRNNGRLGELLASMVNGPGGGGGGHLGTSEPGLSLMRGGPDAGHSQVNGPAKAALALLHGHAWGTSGGGDVGARQPGLPTNAVGGFLTGSQRGSSGNGGGGAGARPSDLLLQLQHSHGAHQLRLQDGGGSGPGGLIRELPEPVPLSLQPPAGGTAAGTSREGGPLQLRQRSSTHLARHRLGLGTGAGGGRQLALVLQPDPDDQMAAIAGMASALGLPLQAVDWPAAAAAGPGGGGAAGGGGKEGDGRWASGDVRGDERRVGTPTSGMPGGGGGGGGFPPAGELPPHPPHPRHQGYANQEQHLHQLQSQHRGLSDHFRDQQGLGHGHGSPQRSGHDRLRERDRDSGTAAVPAAGGTSSPMAVTQRPSARAAGGPLYEVVNRAARDDASEGRADASGGGGGGGKVSRAHGQGPEDAGGGGGGGRLGGGGGSGGGDMFTQIQRAIPQGCTLDVVIPSSMANVVGVLYRSDQSGGAAGGGGGPAGGMDAGAGGEELSGGGGDAGAPAAGAPAAASMSAAVWNGNVQRLRLLGTFSSEAEAKASCQAALAMLMDSQLASQPPQPPPASRPAPGGAYRDNRRSDGGGVVGGAVRAEGGGGGGGGRDEGSRYAAGQSQGHGPGHRPGHGSDALAAAGGHKLENVSSGNVNGGAEDTGGSGWSGSGRGRGGCGGGGGGGAGPEMLLSLERGGQAPSPPSIQAAAAAGRELNLAGGSGPQLGGGGCGGGGAGGSAPCSAAAGGGTGVAPSYKLVVSSPNAFPQSLNGLQLIADAQPARPGGPLLAIALPLQPSGGPGGAAAAGGGGAAAAAAAASAGLSLDSPVPGYHLEPFFLGRVAAAANGTGHQLSSLSAALLQGSTAAAAAARLGSTPFGAACNGYECQLQGNQSPQQQLAAAAAAAVCGAGAPLGPALSVDREGEGELTDESVVGDRKGGGCNGGSAAAAAAFKSMGVWAGGPSGRSSVGLRSLHAGNGSAAAAGCSVFDGGGNGSGSGGGGGGAAAAAAASGSRGSGSRREPAVHYEPHDPPDAVPVGPGAAMTAMARAGLQRLRGSNVGAAGGGGGGASLTSEFAAMTQLANVDVQEALQLILSQQHHHHQHQQHHHQHHQR